ncbi:MAG: hypothetical protein R3C03_06680 [Pirellulaceae bacterium]
MADTKQTFSPWNWTWTAGNLTGQSHTINTPNCVIQPPVDASSRGTDLPILSLRKTDQGVFLQCQNGEVDVNGSTVSTQLLSSGDEIKHPSFSAIVTFEPPTQSSLDIELPNHSQDIGPSDNLSPDQSESVVSRIRQQVDSVEMAIDSSTTDNPEINEKLLNTFQKFRKLAKHFPNLTGPESREVIRSIELIELDLTRLELTLSSLNDELDSPTPKYGSKPVFENVASIQDSPSSAVEFAAHTVEFDSTEEASSPAIESTVIVSESDDARSVIGDIQSADSMESSAQDEQQANEQTSLSLDSNSPSIGSAAAVESESAEETHTSDSVTEADGDGEASKSGPSLNDILARLHDSTTESSDSFQVDVSPRHRHISNTELLNFDSYSENRGVEKSPEFEHPVENPKFADTHCETSNQFAQESFLETHDSLDVPAVDDNGAQTDDLYEQAIKDSNSTSDSESLAAKLENPTEYPSTNDSPDLTSATGEQHDFAYGFPMTNSSVPEVNDQGVHFSPATLQEIDSIRNKLDSIFNHAEPVSDLPFGNETSDEENALDQQLMAHDQEPPLQHASEPVTPERTHEHFHPHEAETSNLQDDDSVPDLHQDTPVGDGVAAVAYQPENFDVVEPQPTAHDSSEISELRNRQSAPTEMDFASAMSHIQDSPDNDAPLEEVNQHHVDEPSSDSINLDSHASEEPASTTTQDQNSLLTAQFYKQFAEIEEQPGVDNFESPDSPTPPQATSDSPAIPPQEKHFSAQDVAALAQSGNEDEVEDYMNQLFNRLRGGSPEAPEKSVPKPLKPAPTAAAVPVQEKTEPPAELEPLKEEDYKPKQTAPERMANMDALRKLANDSTRSAISSFAEQQKKSIQAVRIASIGGGVALAAFFFAVSKTFGDAMSLGGLLSMVGVMTAIGFQVYASKKEREAEESSK